MSRLLSHLSISALLLTHSACLDPLDPITSDCERSGLSIATVSVKTTDCGLPNGEIDVLAFGGAGRKQYFLNDGPPQSNGSFSSLRPGIYAITVMDSLYCTKSVSVHISSGISFKEEIMPIIQANCAISTCHDGSGSISFNVFDNIKKSASDIRGLTQSRIMPKRGTLTNEEIEKIACWVDDGALFN